MPKEAGFTLIEMVISLVLLGIVATFTGLFLASAIEGYVFSEMNARRSLKAQNALDRISLEFQNMDGLNSSVSASSVTYSRNGTTYTLSYSGDTLQLNGHTLSDEIASFSMAVTENDLDYDGNDEVESISLAMTMNGYPSPFQVSIFPRSLVHQP